MNVLASNTLRDSIYGVVYRVSLGAFLSTLDGVTDVYVIVTYYDSESLHGQANALLSMIAFNFFCQLVYVIVNYLNKGATVLLKEVLISLLFLRPAVDAYRVSTNLEDHDAPCDPLTWMMYNKCYEVRGIKKEKERERVDCQKKTKNKKQKCV